jgi:DNA-binding transcriptional regulator YiaG
MKVKSPAPADVRAAREAAGLTQTQAGAVVHSTCRAWQKWEYGESRMHPAFLELFLLKTKLGFLYEIDDIYK